MRNITLRQVLFFSSSDIGGYTIEKITREANLNLLAATEAVNMVLDKISQCNHADYLKCLRILKALIQKCPSEIRKDIRTRMHLLKDPHCNRIKLDHLTGITQKIFHETSQVVKLLGVNESENQIKVSTQGISNPNYIPSGFIPPSGTPEWIDRIPEFPDSLNCDKKTSRAYNSETVKNVCDKPKTTHDWKDNALFSGINFTEGRANSLSQYSTEEMENTPVFKINDQTKDQGQTEADYIHNSPDVNVKYAAKETPRTIRTTSTDGSVIHTTSKGRNLIDVPIRNTSKSSVDEETFHKDILLLSPTNQISSNSRSTKSTSKLGTRNSDKSSNYSDLDPNFDFSNERVQHNGISTESWQRKNSKSTEAKISEAKISEAKRTEGLLFTNLLGLDTPTGSNVDTSKTQDDLNFLISL